MTALDPTLTLVTAPSAVSQDAEFWIGPVSELEDGDGEWGFEIFGAAQKYIAGFVYPDRQMAEAAAQAMRTVLTHAVYIATEADEPRLKRRW